MSVVASNISPLNCRWIDWNGSVPVCTRPPEPPHPVSEAECAYCEHWDDESTPEAPRLSGSYQAGHHAPVTPALQDPLNREECPRCGSHDVVLVSRDAVVQSFACAICHQRWLATRPWPLLRNTRSKPPRP